MKSTKHFLLFIIALISINVNAQEAVSITINVASAGSLPSLIPSSRKEQITNLTLTGFLNGTDIRFIREMAGQNYDGSSTVGILSVLDLSNAKIVGGGEPFIKLYGSEIYSSKDTIGDGTFSNCTRLTSVTLPNSVVTIGMLAFSGCKGLNSVIIPNSVKSIWGYAFSNCPALTSIIIPNSVTFIGSGAFDYCKSLTSITLSNSLTTIGGIAFRYCTSLTSITIPNSVTTIGDYAFNKCSQIKQLYCQGTTPPKIDSNTFSDIYNTCKLYIPKGSSTVYWVAPYWSNFKYITEQVTTSISDCEASNTNVYSENGYIVVKGGKLGDIINIYSVTGSLLHKIKITDDIVRISVAPQSLYIVKTGDRSFKIAM